MRYEIRIGKILVLNAGELKPEPKHKIVISEDQFTLIKTFANITKDKELNEIYKLNDCEFTVVPTLLSVNEIPYKDDELDITYLKYAIRSDYRILCTHPVNADELDHRVIIDKLSLNESEGLFEFLNKSLMKI